MIESGVDTWMYDGPVTAGQQLSPSLSVKQVATNTAGSPPATMQDIWLF